MKNRVLLCEIDGDKIKHIMLQKGLTPSQFAKNAGISRQHVYSYLNAKQYKRITTVQKIAKGLGVDVEEIIINNK